MQINQMEYLIEIKDQGHSLEIIKCHLSKGYSNIVYFDGIVTDITYYNSNIKNKKHNTYPPYNVYKDLSFGMSKYNKMKVKNFFKNIVPEEFL